MIAFHQVSCEGGVEIFHWGVDGNKTTDMEFSLDSADSNKKYQAEKTIESHRKPSKTYSRLGSFQQEPKEAAKPTPSPPEGWLIEVDLKDGY